MSIHETCGLFIFREIMKVYKIERLVGKITGMILDACTTNHSLFCIISYPQHLLHLSGECMDLLVIHEPNVTRRMRHDEKRDLLGGYCECHEQSLIGEW